MFQGKDSHAASGRERLTRHLQAENFHMAWGLVILCVILGSFGALRASGRKKEIRRSKDEDD